MLGISLNDAVIETWKLKYQFNLIRPLTYIQKYISTKFTTTLITPPFPEFPSGHSFQAGTALEILKFSFSDSLSFVDSTNAKRTDINGKARAYHSFTEMAEEMSMSRYYGGIHFLKTLQISLKYGQKIGLNTINQIQFIK